MKITAIFESWHIPDGNYPPLRKGQLVNLSFQVEPRKYVEVSRQPEKMQSLGLGEYSLIAKIIRQYPNGDGSALTVFEADNFRFYTEYQEFEKYPVGTYLQIDGPILLDYYIWVEFPQSYANPPNLFYNLKVNKIVKATIPERFIVRHKTGWSMPTRVKLNELEVECLTELETMEGQAFELEFYAIDFDGQGLEEESIPKTFT
jgi:hypothetical protein